MHLFMYSWYSDEMIVETVPLELSLVLQESMEKESFVKLFIDAPILSYTLLTLHALNVVNQIM